MKSTTGEYYRGLDHIRGSAALLVFVWHFLYGREGASAGPTASSAWGPTALFEQGYLGVALFMSLSGYLFAKLLDGKEIVYRWFLWNRLLRLMPLLALVMAINAALAAAHAGDLRAAYWYLLDMPRGLLFPSWPNGGWSITVELHFYLLLPGLLLLCRERGTALWAVVAGAIVLRLAIYLQTGSAQDAAYWTLLGRLDQFAFGIMAYHYRARLVGRHVLVGLIALPLLWLAHPGSAWGGLHFDPKIVSTSPLWVFSPAIEGLTFASLIAWYDGSFEHRRNPVSDLLAKVGEYSYSIYLLHFFFVFAVARWIHTQVLDLSNLYVALPVALLAFGAMLPFGYLSMRFVERPFLKLRHPYATRGGTPLP